MCGNIIAQDRMGNKKQRFKVGGAKDHAIYSLLTLRMR
jgi:hypothetical protein